MTLSKKIREKFELGDLLHMTNCSNLSSIFTEKALFSKNSLLKRDLKFADISNESVQEGRASISVPCSGNPLHDYVPLFWGRKTPMVSALRSMNEQLAFLVFSTDLLEDHQNQCVITDGNARSNGTIFKNYCSMDDLNILDPTSINSAVYAADKEIKRRKQSELLVFEKLSLKYLQRVICRTDMVKIEVEGLLASNGLKHKVFVGKANYYYLED